MFKALNKNKNGFSLVEVLLSVALFAILATVLLGGLIYGQEGTLIGGKTARATLLAEEGLEAVRNIRDSDYANLVDGTYGLAISGGKWTLSGTLDTTDIFTRHIDISTIDANRKNITASVAWQQNAQRAGSVSLASQLMYWRKIVPAIGNWANPNTLAGSLNLSGNTNGFKIQVQGTYAYVVRSGTANFSIINISNPASPTESSTLNLTGTPSDIAVSGNYAYISGNGNSSELQIVDISNPVAPTLVGTFNAAGNADALGVYILGNYVYLGRATSADYEFAVIDVANPASPTLAGSLDFSADINHITVVGNYAYLATSDTANELRIIDVTNKTAPALVGSLNLTGSSAALTISAFDSTVVIGGGSTLYVVNVTNPALPTQTGSANIGGAINDISMGNNNTYVFMATANATAELSVYNISNPASPTLVGVFNAAGTYNGVAYDSVSDRAYAMASINSSEFNVIAP
jgi:prepilin-type N-terminal cleavage/methylation domain-containing protein